MRSIWRPLVSRFAALALCGVVLLGADPIATPAPPSGDATFAQIAHDYFYAGFAAAPSTATGIGVHEFDAAVDDVTPQGFAKQLARDRDTLRAIRQLDATTLSTDALLDRRLLDDALNDDLLLNGTLASWRHDPDNYTGIASGLAFSLMERDFAPLSARFRNLTARERGIPALLARGDANTTTVDATTKEISALDAGGAVDFYTTDVPRAFAAVKDAQLQAQFRTANAAVLAALRRHVRFIGHIQPTGTFAIGSAAYMARLRYEDGLVISIPAYLAIGERAFAQTRAFFIATSNRIDSHKTPAENYAALAKQHPTPARLNAASAADLVKLRAFLIRQHIVTLPPDANISVIDTPAFERAETTAAMDSPGPLETVATKAYYYVTPVDPAWPAERKEGFLATFNDFQRPIVSAHEVYPGHFVNFTLNRRNHLSLTRSLLTSSEYAEGWAHYSEQMVVDEGWGNGDPRVRLAQLDEALLRNCRFIAGVKLHTAGWSIARTENFFTDRCFQSRATAIEETLRGTQDPIYGYYTLGKLMILKLRADYRRKLGSAYTLEGFHDAFLAHGDPPIPYLRPLLLGDADDGKPL